MSSSKLSSLPAAGLIAGSVGLIKQRRHRAVATFAAFAAVVAVAMAGSTPAIAATASVNAKFNGLQDQQTGRCLDSNAAGMVYTNPCQVPGNRYQDWAQTSLPGGIVSFEDVATSRCLDSNAAGNLYTNPCQAPGNHYQDWGPSAARFVDHATNRCLDSNAAGSAYTLPCNGGNYQNWKLIAGPPAPPSALPRYVALGDSYSSGQGASGTSPAAYYPPLKGGRKTCYRSPNAYAVLLAQRLKGRYQFDEPRDFLACAGAQSAPPPSVNAPSVLHDQVEHMGSGVGLITMTVGGDDAGWTNALRQCLGQNLLIIGGALPGGVALGLGCKNIFDPALSRAEGLLKARLPTLFKTVRQDAPHATVLVAGYPRLVADDAQSLGCLSELDLRPAAANFDNATDALDTFIASWVNKYGFKFVDPRPAFTNHGVCGRAGAWIGGLAKNLIHDVPPPITAFHPTTKGQAGYASAFEAADPTIFR